MLVSAPHTFRIPQPLSSPCRRRAAGQMVQDLERTRVPFSIDPPPPPPPPPTTTFPFCNHHYPIPPQPIVILDSLITVS